MPACTSMTSPGLAAAAAAAIVVNCWPGPTVRIGIRPPFPRPSGRFDRREAMSHSRDVPWSLVWTAAVCGQYQAIGGADVRGKAEDLRLFLLRHHRLERLPREDVAADQAYSQEHRHAACVQHV